MSYSIVLQNGSGEIVEKKSRFIAHVYAVKSEEDALAILEKTRKQYWDARHNCYAYVIGENAQTKRFSDDGEPSGTAGKPILEVLTGAEVTDVLVIVTRYFGGVLLGTGGLVRAYTQATKAGLEGSILTVRHMGKQMEVHTDYNGVGKLQYLTATNGYTILDTIYAEQVTMEVLIPANEEESFTKKVQEATSARASCEMVEEVWYGETDGKAFLLEES